VTAPDSPAPTAENALVGIVRRHQLLHVTGGTAVGSTWVCACGETVRTPGVTRDWAETLHARHAAAAVVAAIRGMDAETLADLIGGEVTVTSFYDGPPLARVLGPWQETP
jgi:hypothetical protein